MNLDPVSAFALVGAALLALVALTAVLVGAVVYIPNHRVGVVERTWSARGSVRSGLIALHGEAGFQPDLLRGGWHVLTPFVFRVHKLPLVTIAQGQLGYVYARDGADLPPTQVLASNLHATAFDDVRAFLDAGGQKGPQRRVLREGTYAMHLVQFVVVTRDQVFGQMLDTSERENFANMQKKINTIQGFAPMVIEGDQDVIGVVTVQDGPGLAPGEIIAPAVPDQPDSPTWHNHFQDADRFLAAGGRRGRQIQTLIEGSYAINRLFATVERVPKTVVEMGYVGVVASYTGDSGADLSGQDYRHGELVAPGRRGVWSEPLMPGKYAFNPFAGRVVLVPTTNFILKWKHAETGAHRFDENLSEISLITRDAFEPVLPVSVVVHIDYRKAPLVVQRFGDVRKLVEQTLDPMVAAWFKNVGQTRTLVELIQDRAAIQDKASDEMRAKFAQYNLELQEVLIGTPSSAPGDTRIETLLDQLRARQIAEEKVETFRQEERAAAKERELREAQSRAQQQAMLTESEIRIAVESNHGKADLARAQQESARIRTLAEAEAGRMRTIAEGEASRIHQLAEAEATQAARVGVAQAMAIEEKVRAWGGAHFQLTQQVMGQLADALREGHIDVVPRVQMGESAGGTFVERLLGVLLAQQAAAAPGEVDEGVRRMREAILGGMSGAEAPRPAPSGEGS